MAYTWIKLFIAILDDPWIGMLSDHLFRIYIQINLVAREVNRGGLLMPTTQLAYRLRAQEKTLTSDLEALAKDGIVVNTPDGWMVVEFANQQAPLSEVQRKQQSRDRSRSPFKGVTKRDRNGHKGSDKPSVSASASDSASDSEYEDTEEDE